METISPRLRKIKETIDSCTCLGDVGTDHALLPIIMIQEGRCSHAVASDLRRGPLGAAKKNVCRFGLEDRIKLRLGSGLSVYRPQECDTMVIAGMGGLLIAQILTDTPEIAGSTERLILQPNTCQPELRRYLLENGYEILDETCAAEERHVYLILTVRYSGKRQDIGDELLLYTGTCLQKKEEGRAYFEMLHRKTLAALTGLRRGENAALLASKRTQNEQLLARLEALLEAYR